MKIDQTSTRVWNYDENEAPKRDGESQMKDVPQHE